MACSVTSSNRVLNPAGFGDITFMIWNFSISFMPAVFALYTSPRTHNIYLYSFVIEYMLLEVQLNSCTR